MAVPDQNSIDQLLDQIQTDADQVKAVAGPGDVAALESAAGGMADIAGDMEPPPASSQSPIPAEFPHAEVASDSAGMSLLSGTGDLHRLLAIEVPVIVQLGIRRMTVGEVMRLGVGAIVEFGKSAEEEMDLLANNKAIGKGHAVKVGENFGIKVSSIGSVKETIRKLGGI